MYGSFTEKTIRIFSILYYHLLLLKSFLGDFKIPHHGGPAWASISSCTSSEGRKVFIKSFNAYAWWMFCCMYTIDIRYPTPDFQCLSATVSFLQWHTYLHHEWCLLWVTMQSTLNDSCFMSFSVLVHLYVTFVDTVRLYWDLSALKSL